MSQEAQRFTLNPYKPPAPAYQVKNQVWLNSRNICIQRPSKKLDDKWISLLSILKLTGKRAYWLELSEFLQIHTIFQVFLLRPIAQDPISD